MLIGAIPQHFNFSHMRLKNIFLLLAAVFLLNACKEQTAPEAQVLVEQPILKDSVGWVTEQLDDGLVHYTFEGEYEPYTSSQRVDVLLVDLDKHKLIFDDSRPNDSLSARVERYQGSLASINGTYYEIARTEEGDSLFSSFFKKDGEISTSVTVPDDHRLFWKHEGAFYYDDEEWGIIYGDPQTYDSLPYANAMSGSPMLIYDYEPVGASFVQEQEVPLDSLDYEHPDRHQGVRHPRTALALTDVSQLLMITVDGRRPQTAGMSAEELTLFIERYFEPQHALNIDGGGSTTMWIKDSDSPNGVVNYPTDNREYNHFGQRRIRNGIIVVKR